MFNVSVEDETVLYQWSICNAETGNIWAEMRSWSLVSSDTGPPAHHYIVIMVTSDEELLGHE